MTDNADEKSEGLRDMVEGRLDDLFAADDEDAREKPEGLQDVVDSRLDNLFPAEDEDTQPQSGSLEAEVDSRLDDLSLDNDQDPDFAEKGLKIDYDLGDSEDAPEIEKAVSAYQSKTDKTKIEAAAKLTDQQEEQTVSATKEPEKTTASDSKNTNVQFSKETTRPGDDNKTGSAEKKPTGKTNIGISPEEKPQVTEAIVAVGVDEKPLPKTSQGAISTEHIGSQRHDPKPKKSSQGLLKLLLGGLFIIGGVLALVYLFKSPEPLDQSQPVTALKTHKIANLPAKTPETEPAPTVTPPIPQQASATIGQSEYPSKEEKRATQLAPVIESPADKAKPAQADPPVTSASVEIAEWLLEWAVAREKCAGIQGDMATFMSFYSDDFRSKGLDKNKWQQDKLEKNRRKEWIRIKLDNINVAGPLGNGHFEAKFRQVYKSSNYTDISNQILILKKETSGWKIIGIKNPTLKRYPYAIHGGSFRTLPTAQKAIAGYRKKRLDSYWTRVDLSEKETWYRVFIGQYDSREAALQIIAAKALIDVRPEKVRYANLIGTYSSEEELLRQRQFIIEKGYSPYVISDANGDLNLYTGAYISLENAERNSAELKARGISSQVVER